MHYNVITKGLNITTATVNIDKRCTLHYNLIHGEVKNGNHLPNVTCFDTNIIITE